MGNCILCGRKVASGGNRHAKNACPPDAKKRKRKKKAPSWSLPKRGMAIKKKKKGKKS